MATHDLTSQFMAAHQRIDLGDRRRIAVAAHYEVRSVLRRSRELRRLGLDDVLVGSFARRVAIWPGKDVDVFGRLLNCSTTSTLPSTAYESFKDALSFFARQGRLVLQPRSLKVEFGPERAPLPKFIREAAVQLRWTREETNRLVSDRDRIVFDFSVDVVPAVWCGDHYGIPDTSLGQRGQQVMSGEWKLTNPVELTRLSSKRNEHPTVGSIGAFVRIVKTVKQIKAHHLPSAKPAGLFYEFILHEGFAGGQITGDSWADITASALAFIARRLRSVAYNPVCDPVLNHSYEPAPRPDDLQQAQGLFDRLSLNAQQAITTRDRCQAAIEWRKVFGNNQHPLYPPEVFPLPRGCQSDGMTMASLAAGVSMGGTEERSFGA